MSATYEGGFVERSGTGDLGLGELCVENAIDRMRAIVLSGREFRPF
jgi:hypothetical protein